MEQMERVRIEALFYIISQRHGGETFNAVFNLAFCLHEKPPVIPDSQHIRTNTKKLLLVGNFFVFLFFK